MRNYSTLMSDEAGHMINAARTEPYTCRICGDSGRFEVVSVPEMMYGSREAFDYVLCGHCGCLQIYEIPLDLARHYPSDYYSQMPRDEPIALTGLKGVVMRWYCRSAVIRPNAPVHALIRSALPVPSDFTRVGAILRQARLRDTNEGILDVGCGASPHRLAAMRRCGFASVEGIDPFVAEDSEYAGVPVRRQMIEQVQGRFGLVMFHHSLEHVADPVLTLHEAARLLRPGGTCLVRIPLMGTYFWRHFGVDWVELDAPRHLHLMTKESVAALARRTGFRVRQVEFDSEPWEIASSILYQRGIPLRGVSGTSQETLANPFSDEEWSGFSKQVLALNAQGDAGRACFYLERC